MTHHNILMFVVIVVAVFIGHVEMASAGESVTEVSEFYTISVSTYPADLDSQPSGSGTYEKGMMVTVEASQYAMFPCLPGEVCPMEVFPFFRWTENGLTVSKNPFYSFVVNTNRNLVADYSDYDSCTAMDIDSDGFVNFGDVLIMVNHWTTNWASGDFTGDNIVNFDDVLEMIPLWGTCT